MLAYDIDTEVMKRLEAALENFDKEIQVAPAGPAVKRGLARMSGHASRFASGITHIDTGTLYRSYLLKMDDGTSGSYAQIYVNPQVVNPRGQRPVVYAPYEFGRGGDHDAFGQTVRAAGPWVDEGVQIILETAAKRLNN